MFVQISALAFIVSFGMLLWALPKKGFGDVYSVPKVGHFKLNAIIDLKVVRIVSFVLMYAIIAMWLVFTALHVSSL